MAQLTWQSIQSDADLDLALQRSHEKPVVIFKHSTRCPVSSMALRLFEHEWSYGPDQVEPFFLDLIAFRPISNRIAQELAVDHESPQLIVVKNGRAIYDRSHNAISAGALSELF
jgi:bacillithiol system protein YtxJ